MVNFGDHLEENKDKEWAAYYLEYDKLKSIIVNIQEGKKNAEAIFIECLERSWNKYKAFIDEWVKSFDDKNVTKQSIIPILRMNNFMYVNQECLRKVIKKHDKNSEVKLGAAWEWKVNYKPFFKLFQVMKQVSKLYTGTGTGTGTPLKTDADIKNADAAAASLQPRKHTKYWVPRESVVTLICLIIQYLPMKLFGAEGTAEESMQEEVRTVYLDTPSLDVYHDILVSKNEAHSTHLRFSDPQASKVYVERKVHSDMKSDVSTVSSDATSGRFALPGDQIGKFLAGVDVIEHVENNAQFGQLASAVAGIVQQSKMVPVVRAEYKRITFQLPGQLFRLDIEIDVNLMMEKYTPGVWSISQASKEDESVAFPFAILEVTMLGSLAAQPPAWFENLVTKSDMLISQPYFSKYAHAAYMFYRHGKTRKVPQWVESNFEVFRSDLAKNSSVSKLSLSPLRLPESVDSSDGEGTAAVALQNKKKEVNKLPKFDVENEVGGGLGLLLTSREQRPSLRGRLTAGIHTPVPESKGKTGGGFFGFGKSASYNAPLKGSAEKDKDRASEGRSDGTDNASERGLRSMQAVAAAVCCGGCFAVGEKDKDDYYASISGEFTDPALYFLNESSFLQWFNASFFICAVGIALSSNVVNERNVGIVLCSIGAASMLHAAHRYYRRDALLHSGTTRGLADRAGPHFLVLATFACILVTFLGRR